jgi:hypothetical protein
MKFVLCTIAASLLTAAAASASCGSASCPLNHDRMFRAGLLSISFSHESIDQDRLYLGSSLSFVGAVPEEHDEVSTKNRLESLTFGYGLSDILAVQVIIPYVHREHTHIAHEEDGDVAESWNFNGFGDGVLMGQMALLTSPGGFGPSVMVTGGVKFPTGVTDFANADGERAEVTIQPGTGSTDFLAGLHYRQTIASVPTVDGQYSALPLIASVTYRVNGRGTDDYRFGSSVMVHVGTEYQFHEKAGALLQINGRFDAKADVGGTHEHADNTGGTWIFASPGLRMTVFDVMTVYGYIQLPVYRHVNGLQQAAKYNLQFGLSYSTNLLGPT